MSELKPYIGPHPTDTTLTEYYLKSEADKVIAELKKVCNDKDNWCLHTLKENRHQKYKRCLAMAAWCELKRIDAADYRIPREKWEFYDKLHKRWLELAEKFKETK